MRSIGWVVTVVVCSAACTQYTTYGYRGTMSKTFGGEEPESAPREARQLLANARTVAFYPPDVCINVDTNSIKAQRLHANCGVLMSSLERAAESAGYEVVSWQNLRGGKRPIDFAREANVDVLFEVNEFDTGDIYRSQVEQTLNFFERGENGAESPLNVSTTLAQSCAQYSKTNNPMGSLGEHGTVDIKTVSVADGRMRWRYRKALSVSRAGVEQPELFRGVNPPSKVELQLGILGGLALLGGATLITLEKTSTDDPLTPQNDSFSAEPWSTLLTVAGVAAIAGAIIYHYEVGAPKPDPTAVLCNSTLAIAQSPAANQGQPTNYAAQHTFETVETNANAHDDEGSRQLQATMIAQFVDELKQVHSAANRSALPPPPPPPSPAAPGAP